MTQEVQDKPTEKGILFNNILTFMILGVMSWVGINITQMKDSMKEMQIRDAVMTEKVMYMTNDIVKNTTMIEDHIHKFPHFQGKP